MTPQRALFLQTALEAALPLIGYFYWNWDTSFILLFYLLDWLLFLGIHIAKAKKRWDYAQLPEEKRQAFKYIGTGITTLLGTVSLVYFTLPLLSPPGFNWNERILSFLTYQDMGIQQGIILIPLILINGIMVYKQQFLRPRLFARLDMTTILKEAVKQGSLLLAVAGVFFGLSTFIAFPPEIMLFSTIAGTTLYRFHNRT